MVEDGLTEKFIELVVCADPKPGNHISAALADSAILCAGPYRPNVLITAKLLELKRRVVWILFEKPIRFALPLPGFYRRALRTRAKSSDVRAISQSAYIKRGFAFSSRFAHESLQFRARLGVIQ